MTGQNIDAPCSGASSGWAPNTDICPTWSNYTPEVQDYATQFATQVIWAGTGRRFGLCSITARPWRARAVQPYVTYPSAFDPWGGNMGSFSWGLFAVGSNSTQLINFASGYGPFIPNEIRLAGPVSSVTSVQIDGATLDPTAYRLDGDRLTRQDGNGWPAGQDLTKPAGQTNTWSITWMRGEPVPQLVNYAAGVYACQVAKARTNQACTLPNRVTNITRQGVSVQVISLNDVLDKGLTGVSDVDQIIRTYNPSGARSRPRVLSQDMQGFR